MQFFSVFDMLLDEASRKGHTENEMYSALRAQGVGRALVTSMKNSSFYPQESEILAAILDYLGTDQLTMDLSLGKIPPRYREVYYSNVKEIANILRGADERKDCSPSRLLNVAYQSAAGVLYQGDCREILKGIESNSVDLIFADPPFNLGKEYDEGINDQRHISSYINWTFEWLDECIRVLREGGYLFVYNIPKWCTYISGYLNNYLTYWDWIALDMKYRLPIAGRLYPAHYALIAYVKGDKPRTFNNQRIPLQTCRHCGGDVKDYGGYKSKMNPLGVNISDVWSDIYPVRHQNTKNRKYNELPVKLLDRIIMMATNEGDTVLDPFGGSGTTYAVSQLRNRRWIGCELGNCEVIAARLSSPYNDISQIKKIEGQKNCLFTQEATNLRKQNRFWLCEDVIGRQRDSQVSMFPETKEKLKNEK